MLGFVYVFICVCRYLVVYIYVCISCIFGWENHDVIVSSC